MITDYIPKELKELDQWLCAKQDKIPVNANTGKNGSCTDPATWCSFKKALSYLDTHGTKYIGFAITLKNNITCIDIDKCVQDGIIQPEAQAIIDMFPGTYIEYSASGNGIHIWCKGVKPGNRSRTAGSAEIYNDKRYIIATGKKWQGSAPVLLNCQDQIDELYNKYFSEDIKPQAQPLTTNNLSDNDIIKKIQVSRQAAKFNALFSGDISGYESQSEADMALCFILAFWTKRDPAQIERIFNMSLLSSRDKWQMQDYRERTIQNACQNCTEIYTSGGDPPATSERKPISAMSEDEKKAAIEVYLSKSNGSHLQEFINGIAASVDTPFIPTGFRRLDKLFDGGLYEGLYIIGAISSLGKTTFILQAADQIAQNGQDILIFSLEMARTELMAKSISRLTKVNCEKQERNAKTTRGITTGSRYQNYSLDEKDLIERSIKQYSEYANNIYIIEGAGNIGASQIREAVERHIELTGNNPIVIIDYLQLLAPDELRGTDKQNTDKAVLELKRISRDHKISVIAISSFNRMSYKDKVTMEAFKESGAIEYSSDVLIGMQFKKQGEDGFDVDKAKDTEAREIEVVILKNRNGAIGKVEYKYNPLFNYFEEV